MTVLTHTFFAPPLSQDTADQLKGQLEMQQKAVDNLLNNTRMLETKLAESKSKKVKAVLHPGHEV